MAELMALFIVGFVAAGTPGPDILLIIRTSIFNSLPEAFKLLLGIVAGNLIMLFIVYLGLGFLSSNVIFKNSVQCIGGLYLFYIGYQIFIHRNDGIEIKSQSVKVGFKDGLIVNLSNPKAILFFTVILTPFLNGEHLELKVLALMAGIVTVFIMVILLAHKLKAKLVTPKIVMAIDLVAVVIFLFFGITMIGSVIF